MARIKLGAIARTVSATAVAGLLERNGGKLRLRAAPWGTGAVLAELPAARVGAAGYSVNAGRATLRFEDALGLVKGDPTWAQVVTAEGEVVFECDVGPRVKKGVKGAALQLEPLTVHPHGTVSVPELFYTQPE